jgi:hypothetical protein
MGHNLLICNKINLSRFQNISLLRGPVFAIIFSREMPIGASDFNAPAAPIFFKSGRT